MAISVLMKEKTLRRTITIVRMAGIAILFLGLGLKITEAPGATIAIVTGAVLMIFARLNTWWLRSTRKHSGS